MHRESKAVSVYPELFHRHADNPILTARDWPYPAHTVFNAGRASWATRRYCSCVSRTDAGIRI
jgi:hypothetical protein